MVSLGDLMDGAIIMEICIIPKLQSVENIIWGRRESRIVNLSPFMKPGTSASVLQEIGACHEPVI